MKKFIKRNWLLIISLLYILSPFDFIPEIFLGPFGIIDDLGLLLVFFARNILSDFNDNRKEIIEGNEVKR